MKKTNRRFIASVLNTAATDMPALPFHRGAARKAFIAKRSKPMQLRKSA